MKVTLTQERLKSVLHYDQDTGLFTWSVDMKTGRGNGRIHVKAGSKAGTPDRGYIRIGVDGTRYWAHRLAFLWMTGSFPQLHVDHMDGNHSNNKWGNLRDVSPMVNMQNRHGPTSRSAHGLLGVAANHKRFMAQIVVDKKYVYLGTHDTPLQANAAYLKAKRELHIGNTL